MSHPLRIVHVAATASGAAWMHAMLRELAVRGHDVSAIISGEDGDLAPRLRENGIRYHVLEFDWFTSRTPIQTVRRIVRLARLLRSIRPDVVQYHLFPSIVVGRLAAWLAGVPARFSMIPGPYYLEAPILGSIETATAWADTKVIASCEYTRELYTRRGVPRDHVELVYYGTDTRTFDPARADPARVRRELGLEGTAPTVGLVAWFYPRLADGPFTPPHLVNRGIKGHDVLLRAVPEVLAAVPAATFLLVGGGWGSAGDAYRREMMTLAAELGVTHAVRFVGPRSDIPDVLAACDVALQCSLNENLGGSIESLLMGRPTIVSNIGGLVDSVKDGRTGLVVPPDDPPALAAAIVRLLQDRALADRLGSEGRRLALERFTLERTVNDLEALYVTHSQAAVRSAARERAYGRAGLMARLLALPYRATPLVTPAFRLSASQFRMRIGPRRGGRRSVPRDGRRLRVIQVAGATENAEWFVDLCRRQRDAGHDVSAVIGYPEGALAARLRAVGIRYQPVRLSFAPDLGRTRVLVYALRMPLAVWQLTSHFRQERPDVVHAHIFNTIISARIAAWMVGVPYRVSMLPGPFHLEARLTRTADRLTWRMDHRVIAGSEWTRDLYQRHGLRPPRLAFVPYAADPANFDPARADPQRIRQELRLDDATPLVGLVAYFYPPRNGWHTPRHLRGRGIKGQDDFISAAHRVRARVPGARFVLVGTGWGRKGEQYRQRLIARAAAEGLGDAMTFLGHRSDVPDILAAMDVAVQCSLSENYGGTVESLLMGVPTVATRVGGMPECVRDDETGLVVPPANPDALAEAIVSLLSDRPRARALAEAGRRLMLARYSTADTAAGVQDVYDDLIAAGNGRVDARTVPAAPRA
jgi:glycosyltransferase involved in cell wall biosynthesis